MSINDGILLVVVAFFASLLYAIRREEHRRADRRQQDQPHAGERRQGERRRKGLGLTLSWAARAWRARLTRR